MGAERPGRKVRLRCALAPCLLLLPLAAAGADEPIDIEAGHFEMLLAEHRAVYTGNVVAVQGDHEMRADELRVRFNEDNEVISMLATGNPARLSDQTADPPITLTGASLEYQVEQANVRATGDAILIQGKDRVTAETISYDLDEDRAQAFSGKQGRVRLTLQPKSD